MADLAARAAVRHFAFDKFSDAGFKARKLQCKKALANLADVTLAANNCTQVVNDGVRQKTIIVRNSIDVKRKAIAREGTAFRKEKTAVTEAPRIAVRRVSATCYVLAVFARQSTETEEAALPCG